VLLLMGGSAYTKGGFTLPKAAVDGANKLWATFSLENETSNALRPFGASSVDSFDFNFEALVKNMVNFA
jgi:chitinase